MSKIAQPGIVSAKDAARYLNMDYTAFLRDFVYTQKLPIVCFNEKQKNMKFHIADLERLIDKNKYYYNRQSE